MIHAKLDKEWQWIKPRVEKARTRSQKHRWTVDGIYNIIASGEASLYINDARNSFVVLRPVIDRETGERGASVVVQFFENIEEGKKLIEEMREILKESDIRFVIMTSSFLGFSRMGWEIEEIVYRRRV